jgi:hypothetical protein
MNGLKKKLIFVDNFEKNKEAVWMSKIKDRVWLATYIKN